MPLLIIIHGLALRGLLTLSTTRRRTAWWYPVGGGQLSDFRHGCNSPKRPENRQSEIGQFRPRAIHQDVYSVDLIGETKSNPLNYRVIFFYIGGHISHVRTSLGMPFSQLRRQKPVTYLDNLK